MKRNADTESTLDRRAFVRGSLLAALGGMTVTITGCAEMSPTAPALPAAFPADVTGTVVNNHGHSAVITAVQLGTNGAVSLQIQGSASHSHTVELSAEDVARIRRGEGLAKVSSGERHTHIVIFNDDVAPSAPSVP